MQYVFESVLNSRPRLSDELLISWLGDGVSPNSHSQCSDALRQTRAVISNALAAPGHIRAAFERPSNAERSSRRRFQISWCCRTGPAGNLGFPVIADPTGAFQRSGVQRHCSGAYRHCSGAHRRCSGVQLRFLELIGGVLEPTGVVLELAHLVLVPTGAPGAHKRCTGAHRRCSGTHRRCSEPTGAVLEPQAMFWR